MRTYSATAAADLAGCTYRQIDYWCRTGVLRCVVEANGSGTRRRFDAAELPVVSLVAQLYRLGASCEAVTEAAAQLRELPLAAWVGPVYVHGDGTVSRSLEGAAWVVDLGRCVEAAVEPHLVA